MLKDFELSVNILTASFWPTYQPDQVILPPEVLFFIGYCILTAKKKKGKRCSSKISLNLKTVS